MKTIHFVAGLPRSGSTLLCNILLQNPAIYASGTSGIPEVLRGIRDGWELVSPFRAMTAADSRAALVGTLRGALHGYYDRIERPVVLDRSRAWPAYIEMLEAMGLGGHQDAVLRAGHARHRSLLRTAPSGDAGHGLDDARASGAWGIQNIAGAL